MLDLLVPREDFRLHKFLRRLPNHPLLFAEVLRRHNPVAVNVRDDEASACDFFHRFVAHAILSFI
ncbi:hypothetical protein D3C74_366200 [compost metagenome]